MEEIKEEPNIPYVDLKRVFAAPTQGIAGDLGINNPYALKNWWNSIQAFPPSDYYVSTHTHILYIYIYIGKSKALLSRITIFTR